MSSLLIGCLSLLFLVPAFANVVTTTPSTNSTMNTRDDGVRLRPMATNTPTPDQTRLYNGTRPYSNTGDYNRYDGTFGQNNTNGNGVTYGNNDGTRMNPYNATYGMRSTTDTIRARATTTGTRSFNWGWLGLIGLFGLAGMRSRDRGDVK